MRKPVALVLLMLCVPLLLRGAISLNIYDFGAAGNGAADDYAAIQKGLEELRKHNDAELLFPPGYYRIGKAVDAAIDLTGFRRAGIRFASGAVLVMDNRKNLGAAAGHAIQVLAPAEDVFFDGVNIEWKEPPDVRGPGDAFYIDATNGTGTISGVSLSDCRAANVPGRGAFFGGVTNVKLRSVLFVDGRGEGVVMDGGENIHLFKLMVQRSRGDALCLAPALPLPEGRSWSNRGVVITQAEISGGDGAGIRLGGVEDLVTEFVTIKEKQIGVSVESGNDLPVAWAAPRQIRLNDLEIQNCSVGVALVCRTPDVPEFRNFDVTLDNCRLSGSGNDNLAVTGVDGLKISRLRANAGRIRMKDFRALSVRDLRIRTGYWMLSEAAANDGAASEVAGATLDRAHLNLDNVDGMAWSGVSILDSQETALALSNCRNIEFSDLRLIRPNRKGAENCRALWIAQGDKLALSGLEIELDSRLVTPLDIAGGAVKLSGTLKAPSEFYSLGSLLRLPPTLSEDHPKLDMDVTALLGESSFVLQESAN